MSLNDLIRPLQERLGNRQTKRLGGLEVNDQFELGRLLNGKITGPRPLQNLVDVDGEVPVILPPVRP